MALQIEFYRKTFLKKTDMLLLPLEGRVHHKPLTREFELVKHNAHILIWRHLTESEKCCCWTGHVTIFFFMSYVQFFLQCAMVQKNSFGSKSSSIFKGSKYVSDKTEMGLVTKKRFVVQGTIKFDLMMMPRRRGMLS